MILVSSCLLGENCKYNGGNNFTEDMTQLQDDKIAVCPETLGGLPVPRFPCEIEFGYDGNNVLEGNARVYDTKGKDVTENFIKGAQKVLEIALENNIKTIYLKQASPSCGCGIIYDGTFSHIKKSGDGVCAALLKRAGIKVIPVK